MASLGLRVALPYPQLLLGEQPSGEALFRPRTLPSGRFIRGRPDQAIAMFQKSLAVAPACLTGCHNLDLACRQMGKTSEAEAVMDQIRWLSGRKP